MLPIPVDIHAMRILIATESIKIPVKIDVKGEEFKGFAHHMKLPEFLRPYLQQFCEEYQVPTRVLSEAIWYIGSNLCSKNPQIKRKNKGRRYNVRRDNRAEEKKSKGRLQLLTNDELPERTEPKTNTPTVSINGNLYGQCERCPIDESCNLVVSSQPYYDHGIIGSSGERKKKMREEEIGQEELNFE
jgi:hypothetical protein